jgi:hypothetical protein
MKVSHGQLESFRANPAEFAARQRPRAFNGPSMFRMWQYALKRVHSDNFDAAAEYLRQTVLSNFKVNDRNEKRLDELVDMLGQYAAAFASLGNVALEVLTPINLVINPKLTIGGEIARLDLVPTGGYAAFVLSREQGEDWRSQIRFPLMQAYFAKKLNCSLKDVAVGIYSVPDAEHELHRFSASRVSAAQTEIATVVARLP